MSGLILGIDPGVTGAWAIIDHRGNLVLVGDLPVAGEGARRMVAGAVLADIIKHHRPDRAVVERVGAMPGQGVASMFKFGQAVGTVVGVLAALAVPTLYVAPAVWKRHHNLPADKESARQRALELWPARASDFARKLDHGRAEASLIGLWGVRAAALSQEQS
jgi:crossover junction endodeoxyribonuclease RuvC